MRFVVVLLWSSLIYGCTDFVIVATDQTLVNGRSLEFATDLQSTLKVFPRGQRVSSSDPDRKKGLEWVSKHGYLGVTALGMNITFDGMNEKGLSYGALWLPGFTQYPPVAPEERKMALDFADLGAWVLGNFASVEEVKVALKDVRVWGHPVPPLPGIPPLHIAVHDAKGNHLVIEFVGGKLQVYDNPLSVLTNSPPFDWQMINLQNYGYLDAENVGATLFRGVKVPTTGQGSGFLGMPGDWTPPSRFVKMATYLRFADSVQDGVNFAEHLLNTVDIPLGEIREKGEDTGDYTQWIVIKDLTHRVFYFRSYRDLALKMIDLKRLDFKTGTDKSLSLNMRKGYVDVTGSLSR
ncbi:MAG TPA: choloylglycine hydrolase family protein [Chlamydiales bacterium]|nr:choloylglycine hydrolase family protein [Chlamydiales bacterium]